MIVDLILLVIFLVFVSSFLYRNRTKIKRQGLLYLYHTSWGVRLIEKTGRKYKKTLAFFSHISVWLGYVLMVVMVYLFGRIVWLYAFNPAVVEAVKVPPITPLIPYLPQIFNLNFFPPFYFSYWILILGIIAISHEFFHGIFAAHKGIKTKTTGFGFFPFFLPIFQAAFVELDEKVMNKKSNFSQRAVLSAGTFANVLTGILGILLMWAFFSLSFTASGVVFDDYAFKVASISEITSINGINLTNPSYEKVLDLISNRSQNEFFIGEEKFLGVKAIAPQLSAIALYYDSPALRSNLSGAISSINGNTISSLEDLKYELDKHSVGDELTITLYDGEEFYNQNLTLEESPDGEPWMGVSFSSTKTKSSIMQVYSSLISYQSSNIYYKPNFEFAQFIYDLLWWFVLISFSVALINMLPMGIFDGGRFFYLTVLVITKSKKIAEKSFKFITGLFLFLLFVIMFFWAAGIF
jgi:membrane-associated protease RseP (regulator of RpoE activity)